MKFPSLRRPVAASVLAGVFGAGVVDAVRTASGGGGALALAVGFYGAAAVILGFASQLIVDAVEEARPPHWRALPEDPARDQAVAAGILAALAGALVMAVVAAAGQRLLIGKMASPKLATIAAAGMVVIGAVPGAAVALGALPLLRRLGRSLPRPRALGATGALLCALAAAAVLAFVFALSRADWRVLDLGPLYALATAIVLGAAHGLFWFGTRAGRALRARLPEALGLALPLTVGVAAAISLMVGSRLPDEAPAFAAVADNAWGTRAMLATARHLTDHDGDGFSARFGGGDCNDARADVYPGAQDVPGDGIDQDCEGGDAKPASVATKGAAADSAPATVVPRPGAFKGNILLVTIDAFRADRLGVAGYGRPPGRSLTPTLDALAHRGAYFRRVWSQAPNTPRSFPSIVTGRYPTGVAFDKPTVNYPNLLPSNHTVFQVLAAAGLKPIGIFSHFYFTADRGISRGFAEWSDDGAGTIAESNKDIASPRIVPRVIERLKEAVAHHERFVVWTHLFEPHSSYMTHPEFPTSLRGVPGLIEKYDYEIAFTDMWVKKLFDAVHALGLDKNTAIVVTADHGEAWGEHKRYFHGTDLFDEQTRVPLIIAIPGQKPAVINDQVGLIDLAPTLLDLVGAPIPGSMRGRSLLPRIEGKPLPPAPIFAEMMPATAWPHQAAMMVDGDHKIIHRISDRRWELYDLAHDPGEKRNLASTPADAALFAALRAKLIAFEERPR